MERTIKVYKSYSFRDKDPIIDRVRTVIQGMGLSYKQVAEASGVNRSTLRGWFNGTTRRPQFATIAAVIIGLGQAEMTISGKRKASPKLKLVG